MQGSFRSCEGLGSQTEKPGLSERFGKSESRQV